MAVLAKGSPSGSSAVAAAESHQGTTAPPSTVPAPSAGAPPKENEALVALGRSIFFDRTLSEPPGTSCESCHDSTRAFAGNNGSTTGVAQGSRPGHFAKRNTPSVLYLKFVRAFHLHWEEDAPLPDAAGGFFWDGRVDSIVDLVKGPLLDPDEMNNGDGRAVARKIAAAPYADTFRRAFGDVLDDGDATLKAVGAAEEAFLTSSTMSPFSSKFDEFLQGRATLTPVEARGLALFRDHAKGGCDTCHRINEKIPDPKRSPFTDYEYDSVGIPRNRRTAANRDDPAYHDLGLCQRPEPKFGSSAQRYCGSFRTPSLRNVAVRRSFMHNGTFSSLRDVVAFYASGRTDPARWYGGSEAFDDLPPKYREYVNVNDAPYNRTKGQAPALNDDEIDAIVAFLETLTDSEFRVGSSTN